MFKKLGISIAHISAYLILLGIIKQLVFYTRYNLPVKYFLSLSDLWLFISDDMLIVLFAILIFTFPTLLLFEDKEGLTFPSHKTVPKEEILDKKMTWVFKLVHYIAGVFIAIATLYRFFTSPTYSKNIVWGLFFIVIIVYLILIPYRKKAELLKNNSFILCFAIALLTITIIIKTAFDIENVDSGRFKGTLVKTSDSTYISNDTSYFIGKTENYIFIYNKKEENTTIIPSDQVTKIVLKSK